MKQSNGNFPLKSISTLFLTAFNLSTQPVQADEFYNFIEIDITKPARSLSQDGVNFKQDYAPQFNFGFGKDFQLNENWQLASTISLSYLNAPINKIEFNNAKYSVDYQELGLWTSLQLKHVNIFEQATPFIKISTGFINSTYQDGNIHIKHNTNGYKATTGLEFNLSNDSSLSVSVGYSSFDDLDTSPY